MEHPSYQRYPFFAAEAIFKKLETDDPRRTEVFSKALTAFVGKPSSEFGLFVSRHSKEVPQPMVESAVKALLNNILDKSRDNDLTIAMSSSKGAVSLGNRQDADLFEILHVVRMIDPKQADELLLTRPSLRSALERFPEGSESLRADGSFSTSSTGGKVSSNDQSKMQADAYARSKAEEAIALAKKDPQAALSKTQEISVPEIRARTLGSLANSVAKDDPGTAKAVLDKTAKLLANIKDPRQTVDVWRTVAEAANRAGENERSWDALQHALVDANALYKDDANFRESSTMTCDPWPKWNWLMPCLASLETESAFP